MGTVGKRERYMQFLRQVPILHSLSDMEVMAVADALRVEEFRDEEAICREGERGDKFYIIEVRCAHCTSHVWWSAYRHVYSHIQY